MASSKAKSLGPRFYDYLDGLREEFGLYSNSSSRKTARPHRFNIYLDGLKCEFELLTEDIELLQKERDESKGKVEALAMELRNVHNICQRCSEGTSNISSSIGPSPLKTSETNPSSSTSVVRRSSQKPNVSSFAHHAVRSSRLVSDTTIPRPPIPIVHHSQTVTPPFFPQTPHSTANVDSGPEEHDLSTTFNYGVGKELHIEIAHELSHRTPVWCVNFSRDGTYLAVGCQDGKSYIYYVQTGTLFRVLRNLLAEEDFIRSVCFSHDGKYLATGSLYNGIYIWEINTKYVRNAFKGRTPLIRSLDFSPNGRLLVSTSEDSSVRLWSMRDGAAKDLTDSYPTNPNPNCNSVVFSPDGGYIAASHLDGMVRVWHVRTGQLMRRVKAHIGVAYEVGFTPAGKGLMSVGGGGGDKPLKYWDFSSWCLTFISSRSSDGCGSTLEEQTLPERVYSGPTNSNCLAISPDGRWAASGNSGIIMTDIRSAAMQSISNQYAWVYSVDFSPAGHYMAYGGHDGTVKICRYSRGHMP